MRKNRLSTKRLVTAAMIAALYTALCLVLAPVSFGMVQVRAAEAFTLLPVFSPVAIWGVTLGCALSNLVGFFMGTNILGGMDILFGTAATLAAAIMSRKLRHIRWRGVPVLSAVPPVILNALIVGGELAVITSTGDNFMEMFILNALYVGLGQLVACFALGLPLACFLERTGTARLCFGEDVDLPSQNYVRQE